MTMKIDEMAGKLQSERGFAVNYWLTEQQ